MGVTDKLKSKKRKQNVDEEIPLEPEFPTTVGLEMDSEDEGDQDGQDASDDGEADAFPEIDTRSDSEEESEEYEESGSDEEEDEDVEEDEDEDDSELSSDEEYHIFPRAKTITSKITGQPKRVYPEIEPDYDSDSSTEDVRMSVEVCTNVY